MSFGSRPLMLVFLRVSSESCCAAAEKLQTQCSCREKEFCCPEMKVCCQGDAHREQETDKKPTGETPFFLLYPCTLPLAPPIGRAQQEASW